jgi:hypothetical protein
MEICNRPSQNPATPLMQLAGRAWLWSAPRTELAIAATAVLDLHYGADLLHSAPL